MRKQDLFIQTRRSLARHHPSAFLLIAQLLFLVLYAVFEGLNSQRALLSALSVLVLALVVWVVTRSASVKWIAWIIAVPTFILSLISALFVDSTLLAWSSLLEAVLYFYTAGSLIAYMMSDYRVTTDELFAAGATFTLLAWGYAYLYMVCQVWIPGSFMGGTYAGELRTFLELLSLSFTNLSATGLGDILPVAPMARVLVMLEQFTGISYVAVVVSRLIGLTINNRRDKKA